MAKVQIEGSDAVHECESGTRMYEAIEDGNLKVPLGCLHGHCGACVVEVVSGGLAEIKEGEKLALRAFDTEEDMRLACLAYLDGDVVVRTLKP
jgi:ferredoxin